MLTSVDGLSEYELRRPMTPTGTNLLGVVKHLIGIEAGYLGACLDRPFDRPLPWIDDDAAGPNRDMWATADESAELPRRPVPAGLRALRRGARRGGSRGIGLGAVVA